MGQTSLDALRLFLATLKKQNSNGSAFKDLVHHFELSTKSSSKVKLVYSSTAHITTETELIQELAVFLLSLPIKVVSDGLIFLCKTLVEQQIKGQSSKVGLLIQAVAHSHPDLFLGRNIKDSPDPPSRIIHKLYEKSLDKVGDTLLWIISQQRLGKEIQPKALEIWMGFYLPLYSRKEYDRTISTQFVQTVLSDMQKLTDIDKFVLPVVPMHTFNVLHKLVFKEKIKELAEIYTTIRFMMFEKPLILTNGALTIYKSLMDSLVSSKGDAKNELLYILCLTMTRSGPNGVLNQWIDHFSDTLPESELLVDSLLTFSAKQMKKSDLNLSLRAIATKISPSALLSKVQKLIKLTNPSPSCAAKVLTSLFVLVKLLVVTFLLYSLVYVQCDTTHHCPLSFDPHQKISVFNSTFQTYQSAILKALEPLKDGSRIIFHDIVSQANAFLTLMLYPMLKTNILPLISSARESDVGQYLEVVYIDFVDLLGKYHVCDHLDSVYVVTKDSLLKGFDFVSQYLALALERVPGHIEQFKESWHSAATVFVEIVMPQAVIVFEENISKAKLLVHYYAQQSRVLFIFIGDKCRVIYSTLVQTYLEGSPIIEQLKDVYALYLEHYVKSVMHAVDEMFKVLEGRPSEALDWIISLYKSVLTKFS